MSNLTDQDLADIIRRRKIQSRYMVVLIGCGVFLLLNSLDRFFNTHRTLSYSTTTTIILLILSIFLLAGGVILFFKLRRPDPALANPANPPDA